MLRLLLVSLRRHECAGVGEAEVEGAATAVAATPSAPNPAAAARKCLRSIVNLVSSYMKLNCENDEPSTVAEGTLSHPSSTVA